MHRPAMRAGWLAFPLAFVLAFASLLIDSRPAFADTNLDVGGEARVSYTGGDSIRVRSTPSYSGSVVTSVPEGWLVAVLDGPISDGEGSSWYKVTARGLTGYIVSDYLARPSSSGSSSSGEAVSAAATMYTTTSLNLRSSASLSGSVLLVMPSGASVNTTGATQNGFSQLTYNGTTGWASSQYLSSNPPSSSGSGTVISNAWVTGGSLNLRSSASTSSGVLLVMPNNAQVGVTGSAQNGFTPVRYNGTNGWAYSQYLSSTQPGGSSGTVISNAWVTGGSLNLRSSASTSSSVLLVMPNNAQVGVTGSAQNGFTPVRYNGTNGWAYSQYLSSTQPGGSSGTVISNAWVTGGSLNLRSSASTSSSVLLVMPNNAQVGVTGSPQNGFTPVRYNGANGWAYSQYLSSTEPGSSGNGAILSNAWVIDGSLNLRSSASTTASVLLVMPNGAQVGVTGSPQNGFTPVRYNGTNGWAYSAYLSSTAPGSGQPEPTAAPATETRYTTAAVNMRSGAGTSFGVITVVPSGAAVTVTGGQTNGFFPVRYNGSNGYISATYLSTSQPAPTPTPGSGNTGGLLVWPVKGGTWAIIQGYNGGTHQNRGSSADYYYSLDIQKTAGASATQGEPVYAPASGTVLWTSGGLLIGMGNGYGIAMFHITIDSSIRSGVSVTQGQYVGYISGPGGSGYQVTPHIDLTLWRLPNGGGSPRISTAFTGDFAISGNSYADIGTYNMHGGKTFTP
ncbi:MAG: SH3 domain-containing protein [Thermomicrobiales bacterium]|nr:SH3 domain-containing protein [Thermomicrobiales bacterium]